MIVAYVNGQNITLEYSGVISDSVRFLTVHFIFDSSWDGTVKTAVFKHGENEYDVALIPGNSMYLGNDTCYVPQEVIKASGFLISAYGVIGSTVITASAESVAVEKSGYSDLIPIDPTPSLWQQVLTVSSEAIETANSVREDADNGEFNGKGIIPGGYTGQILQKHSGENYDTEWAFLPNYCTEEYVINGYVPKTLKINGRALAHDLDLTPDDIGAYEYDELGIPKWDLRPSVQESLSKADTALQSNDILGKQDKPTLVSPQTSSITLADNTIYTINNASSLTFSYPENSFNCYINLTTANSGSISISFPPSSYIGDTPVFSNGETWEISVKDGIIVAGKVQTQ